MYEKGIEKWTPSHQLSNTPASPATNPRTRQQANKPTRQHSNRTTPKKTNPEGQIHTVQIRMENGGQLRFISKIITFLSGCKNVRKKNQKIGFHLPTRAARSDAPVSLCAKSQESLFCCVAFCISLLHATPAGGLVYAYRPRTPPPAPSRPRSTTLRDFEPSTHLQCFI